MIIGQHRKEEIEEIFSNHQQALFYDKQLQKQIEIKNQKLQKSKKPLVEFKPIEVSLQKAREALFEIVNLYGDLKFNAQYPRKLYQDESKYSVISCNGDKWELVAATGGD